MRACEEYFEILNPGVVGTKLVHLLCCHVILIFIDSVIVDDSRIPQNFDWSTNYNEQLEIALHCKSILSNIIFKKKRNVIDKVEGTLIFFDYNIHKPENYKGAAQTFLIYEHLYYYFYLNVSMKILLKHGDHHH